MKRRMEKWGEDAPAIKAMDGSNEPLLVENAAWEVRLKSSRELREQN